MRDGDSLQVTPNDVTFAVLSELFAAVGRWEEAGPRSGQTLHVGLFKR